MLEYNSAIIRPKIKKIIRGNDYHYDRIREHNKYLGEQGYQLVIFGWRGVTKKFYFNNEFDCVELFTEIHSPGFDPRRYDMPEDIAHIQLFITQSLTTGPGAIQVFAVPSNWGGNTVSCIGASGVPGNSAFGNPKFSTGGGGGGGGCGSGALLGVPVGGNINYFIGAAGGGTGTGITWINGTTPADASLVGDVGTNGVLFIPGAGGTANRGTVTHNGGNGGVGINYTGGSSTYASGGGGGGAGGLTTDGSNGGPGILTPGSLNNGGVGGNSDTATGGTAGLTVGNPGATGTDFDASHGAGSGGAGGSIDNSFLWYHGGDGGLYGGAPGGNSMSSGTGPNPTNAAAKQGMIFISYTPYPYTEVYSTS